MKIPFQTELRKWATLIFIVTATLLLGNASKATASERRHSTYADDEASSQHGPLGLGIVLGEPTGFTAKYWTHSTEAFDLGIAYSFNDFFTLYGDYLWHFPEWFSKTSIRGKGLEPYLGVGGVLWVDTESGRHESTYFTDHGSAGIGVRVPIGIEWLPGKPPIGVFAEIVPGVGLIPAVFAFLQGGVGARFYF
ncbi:MAG: hypothetical protein P4M08_13530 [Oligoflexia bacterium]|nr:hypothetical protein [Oligoflexia bacterium]